MRVAISGASGLVGSALMPVLTSAGHEVRPMVRRGGGPARGSIAWDLEAGALEPAALEGWTPSCRPSSSHWPLTCCVLRLESGEERRYRSRSPQGAARHKEPLATRSRSPQEGGRS